MGKLRSGYLNDDGETCWSGSGLTRKSSPGTAPLLLHGRRTSKTSLAAFFRLLWPLELLLSVPRIAVRVRILLATVETHTSVCTHMHSPQTGAKPSILLLPTPVVSYYKQLAKFTRILTFLQWTLQKNSNWMYISIFKLKNGKYYSVNVSFSKDHKCHYLFFPHPLPRPAPQFLFKESGKKLGLLLQLQSCFL